VDLQEGIGIISANEAVRWKQVIFGLLELWGLEPELATTSALR
jgi:hypothetical protein